MEKAEAGVETALTAYVHPLAAVPDFKYLGWVISAYVNEWTILVHNFRKAKSKWERFSQVLGREGADDRTLGVFYIVFGLCGTSLRVRDVGYVPTHWEDAGQVPILCGTYIDGTASKEEARWDLGLTPTGGGDGGGGNTGGGEIR